MTDWTDERVETLKGLHAKGLSCRRIARELGHGVTRNAVIGKCYRLGLKRDLPSQPYRVRHGLADDSHAGRRREPRMPRAPRAPRPAKPPKPRLNNLMAVNMPRRKKCPIPQDQREAIAMIDVSNAKPWLERAFGECAYPVSGEGADTISCCNASAGTYCAAHAEIMFVGPKEPPARLIKWGVRFAA